jgi:Flp pilus assembly protein TadG
MKQTRRQSLSRQRGAAAIEFVFTFISFFAIFYAIVSYSLAFLLMQGFTVAAEAGARAGIAVNPGAFADINGYIAAVGTASAAATTQALAWLPASIQSDVTSGITAVVNVVDNAYVINVNVPYPDFATLMPVLELPFVGSVPALPDGGLVGAASVPITTITPPPPAP